MSICLREEPVLKIGSFLLFPQSVISEQILCHLVENTYWVCADGLHPPSILLQ